MKHSTTRELFDYWNARRGRRPAPARGDIEPEAIRRVLADTFIFGLDDGKGHPFRIAGTRVCALFGRELKGEPFLDLWAADSRGLVGALIRVVAQESVGMVVGVSGVSKAGDALDLELLALPLAHCGGNDARVLGSLSPIQMPRWAGANPLGELAIETLRYVGPAVKPDAAPSRLSPLVDGRVRHGLLVYDGGGSPRSQSG
jgi:hypothetical protein